MIDTQIQVEQSPSESTDWRLLRLHGYWVSLCRGGEIPNWKDVKPSGVPRGVIRYVFLLDVLNNPRDFRFRLAGTAFGEGSGLEVTGLSINEVFPPAYGAKVLKLWSHAVDARKVLWGSGHVWTEQMSFMPWQGLVMPLRSDDGEVVQLIGGAVFDIALAKQLKKA